MNEIVESRALVTKAGDAITQIGKLNTMLINEKKNIKPAVSESYQYLCDKDFSQSTYLLGNSLPEELKPDRNTSWRLQFQKDKKPG